ncbi:hypothetical protein MJO29_011244, partial [Puccinia striiformis f. sp. tritici]
ALVTTLAAACFTEQCAGRSRLCRRESRLRASRNSRINQEHRLTPSLSNLGILNHRVRLSTDLIIQHHELLIPIMKCFIVTVALCGAAFASTIGAMNVVIKGKELFKASKSLHAQIMGLSRHERPNIIGDYPPLPSLTDMGLSQQFDQQPPPPDAPDNNLKQSSEPLDNLIGSVKPLGYDLNDLVCYSDQFSAGTQEGELITNVKELDCRFGESGDCEASELGDLSALEDIDWDSKDVKDGARDKISENEP